MWREGWGEAELAAPTQEPRRRVHCAGWPARSLGRTMGFAFAIVVFLVHFSVVGMKLRSNEARRRGLLHLTFIMSAIEAS